MSFKKILVFWSVLFFAVNSAGADINISGFVLRQYNASVTYTLPDTVIPDGYFLVLCRGNKTKTEFENFWNVSLASNVIFLDSSTIAFPQQNGAEIFSLHDASDAFIDSTTLPQLTTPRSIQRDSSSAMTFSYYNSSQANPGTFANSGYNSGLVITEVADSSGTGNYLFEFIELYNDGGSAVNTPPQLSFLAHTPSVPVNLQKVTASCIVKDNGFVAADSLFYRVNSGSWIKVYRDSLAGDTIFYSIPGQSTSSIVQYYVWAKDDEGLSAVSDTNSYTVGAVSKTKVKRILFDYTKNQTAGNADWIIDTNWPVPLPSDPTAEDDWLGGISSWGFELDTAVIYNSNTLSDSIAFDVFTLPPDSAITYGTTRPMDLKNFDVYVVCEPQNPFSSAESTAIFNFVFNGGGLFMVADHVASDRDLDGWDSPQIWDALGSDNFGMHFYQVGEGNNNLSVSTTDYSLTNDTLVNGPFGSVIGGDYNFHAGTMIQQSASALEVALYNTSYSMFSVSFYGPHNGRVAGTGDSSPCDDSTGQAGNTLYDGWNEGIDRALILNATYWLSIDSLDYTQTSSVDASCVSSDNVVTIRLSIANHHSYSSIAILRKLSKESSFQRAASFKSNSVIEFTDILPEEYSGTVSYKIMGINESSYEIAFFDVFVSRHSAAGKTYFAHGDFLKVNDKAGRMFVITDILGREILSGDDAALIPIKSLPSGMFFLSTGMDKDISRVLRIK